MPANQAAGNAGQGDESNTVADDAVQAALAPSPAADLVASLRDMASLSQTKADELNAKADSLEEAIALGSEADPVELFKAATEAGRMMRDATRPAAGDRAARATMMNAQRNAAMLRAQARRGDQQVEEGAEPPA